MIKTFIFLFTSTWLLITAGCNYDVPDLPPAPNFTPVPAPDYIEATVLSETAVQLEWTDNWGNEDGFRIFGKANNQEDFSQLAELVANVASLTLNDLNPATEYQFKICGYNDAGIGDFSQPVTLNTLHVKPTSPSGLLIDITSDSEVTLYWFDRSANENEFQIYQSIEDTLQFRLKVTVSANDTSAVIGNLQPFLSYFFFVRAVNDYGISENNQITSVIGGRIPPPAPTELTAQTLSDRLIKLAWLDNSENEEAFELYRSTNPDSVSTSILQTLVPNTTEVFLNDHNPHTTYYYQVRATNRYGVSVYSDIAFAHTYGPPAAPTDLNVQTISETEIELNWTSLSDSVDGFQVFISHNDSMNFTLYDDCSQTQIVIDDLTPLDTYYFKVRSQNDFGFSAFTSCAWATAGSFAPVGPINLTAQVISEIEIRLAWEDISANEENFQIYEKQADENNFSFELSLEPNIEEVILNRKEPNTDYEYKLHATNRYGSADFSNVVRVSTSEASPLAPSDLQTTVVQGTTVRLTWMDNSELETDYEIYMGTSEVNVPFHDRVPANTTEYTLADLEWGTQYYFQVCAVNAYGQSEKTQVISAITSYIFAFVADGQEGLKIIDVTDTSTVYEISRYDTPGFALDVVVVGNFVYLAAADRGLRIIDITDLRNPIETGFILTTYASELKITGNTCYIADGSDGLKIVDITSPQSPQIIGSLDTPGYSQGLEVIGNTVYLADGNGGGLKIINIGNPQEPEIVGEYLSLGSVRDVAVNGNYFYVADGAEGLQILQAGSPNPTRRGGYNTPGDASRLVFNFNTVFLADRTGGLQIINVTNPANPSLTAEFDTPGGAFDLAIRDNIAYIADGSSGLQIIDFSNRNDLRIIGSLETDGNAVGIEIISLR